MADLAAFLEAAGYRRVALRRTGVGHFEADGTLNDRAVRDYGSASLFLRDG